MYSIRNRLTLFVAGLQQQRKHVAALPKAGSARASAMSESTIASKRRRYRMYRPHGLHGPKSRRILGGTIKIRPASMTIGGTRSRSSFSAGPSAPNMARRIKPRAILVIGGSVSNSRPSGQVAISRITSSSMICS